MDYQRPCTVTKQQHASFLNNTNPKLSTTMTLEKTREGNFSLVSLLRLAKEQLLHGTVAG